MPVLPDVASTIVVRPGSMRPSRSAASIMATPMRSLTEPPGLNASSLPYSSTSTSSGSRRVSRTIGVLPTCAAMLIGIAPIQSPRVPPGAAPSAAEAAGSAVERASAPVLADRFALGAASGQGSAPVPSNAPAWVGSSRTGAATGWSGCWPTGRSTACAPPDRPPTATHAVPGGSRGARRPRRALISMPSSRSHASCSSPSARTGPRCARARRPTRPPCGSPPPPGRRPAPCHGASAGRAPPWRPRQHALEPADRALPPDRSAPPGRSAHAAHARPAGVLTRDARAHRKLWGAAALSAAVTTERPPSPSRSLRSSRCSSRASPSGSCSSADPDGRRRSTRRPRSGAWGSR